MSATAAPKRPNPIEMIRRYALLEFQRSCRDSGNVVCPVEADGDLNDAQRAVVNAYYKEFGQAWLGNVNLHETGYDDNQGTPLWKHDGGTVLNFGASFVVPAYDAELERLIMERNTRREGGYDPKHNYDTGLAIHKLVEELGGTMLVWS